MTVMSGFSLASAGAAPEGGVVNALCPGFSPLCPGFSPLSAMSRFFPQLFPSGGVVKAYVPVFPGLSPLCPGFSPMSRFFPTMSRFSSSPVRKEQS